MAQRQNRTSGRRNRNGEKSKSSSRRSFSNRHADRKVQREIFINGTANETRIAITENGQLAEIIVERSESKRMVGDIYKGTVARVNPGMRAAFIDIGHDHDGFLHFSDFSESAHGFSGLFGSEYDDDKGNNPEPKKIRGEWVPSPGQEVIVQVTKEPIHEKGPRVTTHVSLPGHFLVLVPNDKHVGISRKLSNYKEKRRLQRIARQIRPDNFGIIIRTAAEGKDSDLIKTDLDSLMSQWREVERKLRKSSPPSLVYTDMEMAFSVIRDLFTKEVKRVVIDSRKIYRRLQSYLKQVTPQFVDKLEIYREPTPIFDKYHVETEIQKTQRRKVWLKSGGYILIDHTEALVTVDVNSGRFQGKEEHELNSLKINLEAVPEIARQLRLRDIGGLIVIDFIDMEDMKHRKMISTAMRKEMVKDRARSKVMELSELGLIEMTRQRIGPGLLYTVSEICPVCNGLGRVASKETLITQMERWIKRMKTEAPERRFIMRVHPDVAFHFSNEGKNSIRRLMWKYWLKINLEEDSELSMSEFRMISGKTGDDVTDKFLA